MNYKRLLLAAIAGAVVAFIWNNVSWMALNWHHIDFRRFADDAPVAQTMLAQTQDSGIYMLPNADPNAHQDPDKHQQWMDAAAKGPFAVIFFKRDGMPISFGVQLAKMVVIQLIIALLLTWMLAQTQLTSLFARAMFICIGAVAGGGAVHLLNWAWWGFPLAMTVVNILDIVIAWFLAGLAIGKIYKTS